LDFKERCEFSKYKFSLERLNIFYVCFVSHFRICLKINNVLFFTYVWKMRKSFFLRPVSWNPKCLWFLRYVFKIKRKHLTKIPLNINFKYFHLIKLKSNLIPTNEICQKIKVPFLKKWGKGLRKEKYLKNANVCFENLLILMSEPEKIWRYLPLKLVFMLFFKILSNKETSVLNKCTWFSRISIISWWERIKTKNPEIKFLVFIFHRMLNDIQKWKKNWSFENCGLWN
jgi:hypothetical protein